jgi:sensor histidine kinase YesM
MHPFLRTPKQFLMVGLLWSPVCFWVIFLLVSLVNVTWWDAVYWAVPPMVLELFVCLSLWYYCRMTAAYGWRLVKMLWTHLVIAILLTGLWLLLILLYSQALGVMFKRDTWVESYLDALPVFFAVGMSLYFVAVLTHYLILVVERNRRAEQEVLTQKVLAGEAELRALKATVHPHFLFNSLNMLGPMMGTSAANAREVVSQLSDFLLYSFRYGKQKQVTVRDEVEHINNYLAIERLRLAGRMNLQMDIEDAVLDAAMLPLTLLPLAENAIKHGISQCLEPCTLRISIKNDEDRVSVIVSNPFDESTQPRKGEGMGLETLKKRIAARYGSNGIMNTRKEGGIFYVELRFPVSLDDL